MTRRLGLIITVSLFMLGGLSFLPTTDADDRAAPKALREPKTFARDVAPIFYRACVHCHRPDDIGPMSLITYKDARPWARSIREKVITHRMPPWHADPHFGKFSNDARLTQEEIDTIVAWVDQGAKEGNRKESPSPPQFYDGWKIGKPDVVLAMPQEYSLSAEGPDEYINFTLPTSFKEDVWVQAAEIHPGNKKIVHHVVAFIQTPQMIEQIKARRIGGPSPQSIFYQDGTLVRTRMDAPVYDDGCSAPSGGFARGSGQEGLGFPLCFYTPGKSTDVWPTGTAKLIPAGSNIVIQMHYSRTTGRPEKDLSRVGLVLAKAAPEKVVTSFGALNHYFKIPPGADNHEVKGCYTFSRDVELYTFLPHMHLRGKDMKYEAVYLDGRRETLLFVPSYNFNWQLMYRLEQPLVIPKGTKLIVTAHFDNSQKNKYNPDPTKPVRFGDPTYDEMMVGYFEMVNLAPRRTAVAIDAAILDAYVGEYSVGPGVSVKVSRRGNKLVFASFGMPDTEAVPESETKFFFREVDAQATFTKNERGEVTDLLFEINGRRISARRVIAPRATTR